jgi:hypothetical protein
VQDEATILRHTVIVNGVLEPTGNAEKIDLITSIGFSPRRVG